MKRIIAIDPGHSGWCVCWKNESTPIDNHHPTHYAYITGKEKPNTIGCPNLCDKIAQNYKHPMSKNLIIVVEKPQLRYFKKKDGKTVGLEKPHFALSADVGYIAGYFDLTVVLCHTGHWKKHLERLGFLPSGSGNILEDHYTAHLNKHFDMNMVSHRWAAWGMCLWGMENIDKECE